MWITGASSGIGEELARQLDRAGAQLILSARNVEKLNELKESLKYKEQHLVVQMDLAETSNVGVLAQQIMTHYGRIDLLINI